MRALTLGLWVLVAACGSTPPPVAPQPKPPSPARPIAEAPEPEPPPVPLSAENVDYEQKSQFLLLGLGTLKPPLMPEEELLKRLPAPARVHYQAVIRARKAFAKTEVAEAAALYLSMPCEDCGSRAVGEAKYKAAARANRAARTQLERAVTQATAALEKIQSTKGSPEVGIALARLQVRGTDSDEEVRFERPAFYSDSGRSRSSESTEAIAPLQRAVELSALDLTGRLVRLELVHHLMATTRAAEAAPLLAELLDGGPEEWRAELLARSGILFARSGNDAAAADSFARARTAVVDASSVSLTFVLSGELSAHYRTGQFARVLEIAALLWDERVKPRPAPPPPPPAPAAAKRSSPQSRSAGILSLLGSSDSAFGVLGSMSFGATLTDDHILRLATDAVERSNPGLADLPGAAGFRSGLLTRLAVRSLYRSDEASARRHAEAAISVGTPSARDAYRVLAILERRAGAGDEKKAELEAKRRELGYGRGTHSSDPEYQLLQLEEAKDAAKTAKAQPSATERGVRSLVRLCMEPVHERLPAAESGKKTLATLALRADVFEGGRVEVEATSDDPAGSIAEVLTCLRQLAPRVLASVPASAKARIALDASVRRGEHDGWSSAFGFGGLGSGLGRGGGGIGSMGSGGSIGIGGGGIGGIGTRGGGIRLGGAGGKKPAPRTPAKKP